MPKRSSLGRMPNHLRELHKDLQALLFLVEHRSRVVHALALSKELQVLKVHQEGLDSLGNQVSQALWDLPGLHAGSPDHQARWDLLASVEASRDKLEDLRVPREPSDAGNSCNRDPLVPQHLDGDSRGSQDFLGHQHLVLGSRDNRGSQAHQVLPLSDVASQDYHPHRGIRCLDVANLFSKASLDLLLSGEDSQDRDNRAHPALRDSDLDSWAHKAHLVNPGSRVSQGNQALSVRLARLHRVPQDSLDFKDLLDHPDSPARLVQRLKASRVHRGLAAS